MPAVGVIVQNLTNKNGRWKFRKGIPARLRPHIEGNITEFVRWLGEGAGQPSAEVLRKYADCQAECQALLSMAEKRACGFFDEITQETIAHIIATARHELANDDEDDRFDDEADEFFERVKEQLEASGAPFEANTDPDRRWSQRQETLLEVLSAWREESAKGKVSAFIRDEVLDRCAGHGLRVDPKSDSFKRLGRAYLHLLIENAEASLKRQQGEVVPIPPVPTPRAPQKLKALPDQTITGLVEDWWRLEAKAAGRSVSTREAYQRAARQLSEFLKHDDALAVEKADVIRFKEHRLASGVSLKTVGDGDLASLRAVFNWGLANGKVVQNPADGVVVLAPKRPSGRAKGFTDAEAEALLTHAFNHVRSSNEDGHTAAAKRWVPWLCAYTGARVGEMVQLRKQDVQQEGGVWIVTISPDAVTVKDNNLRKVPLHPHLVEQGFPEFVEGTHRLFLFINPKTMDEAGKRRAWKTGKNRVREFAREVT
jgi:integrase